MKLFIFLLIVIFYEMPMTAADKCQKLKKATCLENANCRWSKPNKACIENSTAANTSRPTDNYSTKDGAGAVEKNCSAIKTEIACGSGNSDECNWDKEKKVCVRNPNAPISQKSSSRFNPMKANSDKNEKKQNCYDLKENEVCSKRNECSWDEKSKICLQNAIETGK